MWKAMILAAAVLGAVAVRAQAPSPQAPAAAAQAPTAPATPTSAIDSEFGMVLALVDRIQKILDEAIEGKTGPVTIERGKVDEMRAELAQIRSSLKAGVTRTDR